MCNIWKNNITNEITPEQIKKALSSPSFSTAKHLGISGGEPTLRRDLVECVRAITEALPSLKTLSITSHGYHTNRWSRFLPEILNITEQCNVAFSLNISIDGHSSKHDAIRGIEGAFSRADATIDLAHTLGVKTQLQYTISDMNAYSMQMALDYAKSKNTEIIFRIATRIERLYNEDRSVVFVSEEQKSFIADFFSSSQLIGQTRSLSRKLYYHEMQSWLTGKTEQRSMPCYFKKQGLLLTSKLAVYPCSVANKPISANLLESEFSISPKELVTARDAVSKEHCSTCIHDQSGPWSPSKIILYKFEKSRAGSILGRIINLTKNSARSSYLFFRALEHRKLPSTLESATIIGAYGGEHVGDAAILGGVIIRAKKQGINKFRVLSLRPDRTRKWVNSLSIPDIQIDVFDTSWKTTKEQISRSDCLLYAGGPIMDAPVNLSYHLACVLLAKSMGRKFLVEGVGIGPYRRNASKILASLILRRADNIVLRSRANIDTLPFSRKISITKIEQDPAFDYLNFSKSILTSTSTDRELLELRNLDKYISGRDRVLFVNLRPLWSAYISEDEGSSAEEVDLMVSEKISSIINSLPNEWAVVFCPFNPDTYGFSDFSSFSGVIQKLNTSRDYYVIEYEPGISFMLKLLSRCTHLLAMRFHACIFGLANNINVYGLDYQIGGTGKVANLFQINENTNWANITNITPKEITSWLNSNSKP